VTAAVMLRIRDLGKDQDCLDLTELFSALERGYRGKSVSVTYSTSPNGLLKTVFIDVGEEEILRDSYTGERILFPTFADWDGPDSEAWHKAYSV